MTPKWKLHFDGIFVSGRTLQWRHNVRDGVSNHQSHDCLFNRLFRRRSKKTSKLRVTGLCEGNSPVTSEFPAQRASNAENAHIFWRHHDLRRSQWRKFRLTDDIFNEWSFFAYSARGKSSSQPVITHMRVTRTRMFESLASEKMSKTSIKFSLKSIKNGLADRHLIVIKSCCP